MVSNRQIFSDYSEKLTNQFDNQNSGHYLAYPFEKADHATPLLIFFFLFLGMMLSRGLLRRFLRGTFMGKVDEKLLNEKTEEISYY